MNPFFSVIDVFLISPDTLQPLLCLRGEFAFPLTFGAIVPVGARVVFQASLEVIQIGGLFAEIRIRSGKTGAFQGDRADGRGSLLQLFNSSGPLGSVDAFVPPELLDLFLHLPILAGTQFGVLGLSTALPIVVELLFLLGPLLHLCDRERWRIHGVEIAVHLSVDAEVIYLSAEELTLVARAGDEVPLGPIADENIARPERERADGDPLAVDVDRSRRAVQFETQPSPLARRDPCRRSQRVRVAGVSRGQGRLAAAVDRQIETRLLARPEIKQTSALTPGSVEHDVEGQLPEIGHRRRCFGVLVLAIERDVVTPTVVVFGERWPCRSRIPLLFT